MSLAQYGKRKLIYGVGVNDFNGSTKVNGVEIKPYRVWKDMLKRCCSVNYKEKYPSYKNTVCDESWYSLTKFIEDVEQMRNAFDVGYCLDKNLFGDNFYSKENCCFLPKEINEMLSIFTPKGSIYGVGIRLVGSKFQVRYAKNRKELSLGYYSDLSEAQKVSLSYRKGVLCELAEKYKDEIDERVYLKLLNYLN